MDLNSYKVADKPYYYAAGDEVALFEAAHEDRIPLMLKGPTGCGKTRFVEHMAWKLGKPIITVACHEDMTASDLVGRYLLDANGTVWQDGPLTLAVRYGAICYLDEVVEARQDTTVIIHPITDDRRVLPLDKKNELIKAHDDFHLVISYNPGYQSVLKDLKESTKQRFAAIEFDYPGPSDEAEIISSESGAEKHIADILVKFAECSRNIKGQSLVEGASTRMLIQAARMHKHGIDLLDAATTAIILPITDDADTRQTLKTMFEACQ